MVQFAWAIDHFRYVPGRRATGWKGTVFLFLWECRFGPTQFQTRLDSFDQIVSRVCQGVFWRIIQSSNLRGHFSLAMELQVVELSAWFSACEHSLPCFAFFWRNFACDETRFWCHTYLQPEKQILPTAVYGRLLIYCHGSACTAIRMLYRRKLYQR